GAEKIEGVSRGLCFRSRLAGQQTCGPPHICGVAPAELRVSLILCSRGIAFRLTRRVHEDEVCGTRFASYTIGQDSSPTVQEVCMPETVGAYRGPQDNVGGWNLDRATNQWTLSGDPHRVNNITVRNTGRDANGRDTFEVNKNGVVYHANGD